MSESRMRSGYIAETISGSVSLALFMGSAVAEKLINNFRKGEEPEEESTVLTIIPQNQESIRRRFYTGESISPEEETQIAHDRRLRFQKLQRSLPPAN